MNTNVIPLSTEKHKAYRFKNDINYERVQNENLIPLVIQEFVVTATEFPIVFVKNEQTGEFQSVAVLGFQQGENFYCDGSSWEGLYIPRLLRNYPFSLAYKDENKDEYLVCVDQTSSLMSEEQGEPLFDEEGEQTEYLKNLIENMQIDAENMKLTAQFVKDLVAKELLVENSLTIEIDGQKGNIKGVYIVDEKKLRELPIEQYDELRQRGVLPAIYAQMNSLQQIPRLIRKKQSSNG